MTKPATGSFIQPVDTCCCGTNLDGGIKIIILVHSCTSFFYIATCFSNIVLERPTMGNNVSPMTQTFNCAWALATIPFIVSGISGVKYHVETHLRVYMYWLMATVGFDLALSGFYINKTMCQKLPSFLASEGAAFACGTMRVFGIAFMALLFCFAFYAIFVVWSRCEELGESGSEPAFDFLISENRARQRRNMFEHKSGLFGTGAILPLQGIPVFYGSAATPGVGGGAKIFQGRTHDYTEFPVPHKKYTGTVTG